MLYYIYLFDKFKNKFIHREHEIWLSSNDWPTNILKFSIICSPIQELVKSLQKSGESMEKVDLQHRF